MRTLLRLCTIVALACAPALASAAAAPAASAAGVPQVLVITTGNAAQDVADYAVERLEMEARRWSFTLIEGTAEDLADLDDIDVVMFLNTGEELLDESQQDAVEAFVEGGGGLIATNSAAATEPDWDWYHEALGATVLSPPADPATEEGVSFNAGSRITEGLDGELELTEHWYHFDPRPAGPESTILAELDSGAPVAWTSEGRRFFYASPGGDGGTWGERDFLQLIRQAVWWGAGEEGALVQNTEDAAPTWPYVLTVVLFIIAVAGGGSIAVWRLDREETAKEAAAAA